MPSGFFSMFKKRTQYDEHIIATNDINTNKISNLIGDKILEIRVLQITSSKDYLDYNLTYIVLEKNGAIYFPVIGEDSFVNVKLHKSAKPLSERFSVNVYGQTIKNIYSSSDNIDSSSIIELENGYILYEKRVSPHGALGANLYVFPKKEFRKRVKKMKLHSLNSI